MIEKLEICLRRIFCMLRNTRSKLMNIPLFVHACWRHMSHDLGTVTIFRLLGLGLGFGLGKGLGLGL